MVDQDKFARSAAPGWAQSARAVGQLVAPLLLGSIIERDLYNALRRHGGVQAFARVSVARGEAQIEDITEVQALQPVLIRYVWHNLFGPVLPRLVGEGGSFPSAACAKTYTERALAASRLDILADRLVGHPDGRGLRRPPRPRTTTAELLDEDMPEPSWA